MINARNLSADREHGSLFIARTRKLEEELRAKFRTALAAIETLLKKQGIITRRKQQEYRNLQQLYCKLLDGMNFVWTDKPDLMSAGVNGHVKRLSKIVLRQGSVSSDY